jgi:hypothetical protein
VSWTSAALRPCGLDGALEQCRPQTGATEPLVDADGLDLRALRTPAAPGGTDVSFEVRVDVELMVCAVTQVEYQSPVAHTGPVMTSVAAANER